MRQVIAAAMLTILITLLTAGSIIPQQQEVSKAYNPANLYREKCDHIKASTATKTNDKWPEKNFIWKI
ncbi:MAG: hypothetical protein FH758_11015 [Firmicutes bacterium]|nr:hypothetical protein [Bacillota bacterium]